MNVARRLHATVKIKACETWITSMEGYMRYADMSEIITATVKRIHSVHDIFSASLQRQVKLD